MKILFVGDIVGSPGRDMVKRYIEPIRTEHAIDFVIANAENAAGGFGITPKVADELRRYGIDAMTSGNHIFDKDTSDVLNRYPILRPLNFSDTLGGRGMGLFQVGNEKIGIINAMGCFGMPLTDNPFRTLPNAVKQLSSDGADAIFIDFHAEATSEKNALLHMLHADVSVIAGTHTHVGTDDLQIVDGCGYVSDVGLSGCRDGVIGMESEQAIARFTYGHGKHFSVPKECKKIFQAIVFDIRAGRCVDAYKLRALDEEEHASVLFRAYR